MIIFEYQSIFQSFCVRNVKFKGFIWVFFHSLPKAQLSAFLSVLPSSISQQICRKFSEKMKILFFVPIIFAFMLNKNRHLNLLIRQLLLLLPGLIVFHFFIFRHNGYLKKKRNFSEKSENFRKFFKAFVLGITY